MKLESPREPLPTELRHEIIVIELSVPQRMVTRGRELAAGQRRAEITSIVSTQPKTDDV